MAVTGFGINSYAYTQTRTAADTVRHLLDLGHGTFELMMYPGHLWPGETDVAALPRLVREGGGRIATLNMPNVDVNLAAIADEARALSLDMCGRLVRLAGELGASGVVIGTGKANPLLPARRETLEGHLRHALDVLAPLAAREGTAIFLENLPFGVLPRARDLAELLRQHGDASVGICYDVANGHFIGEDPAEGLRLAAPWLRLVHVSDTGRDAFRHDTVGTGDVPFDRLPPVLDDIGYREVAMLEVISADPDASIEASIRRLREAGWQDAAG